MAWFDGRILLNLVRSRNVMKRGSGSATARILDCQTRVSRDQYGTSTTYYVKFEFTPMLAENSSGPLTLNAMVSKEIYERLASGTTATVTYATADPRVVLFEGE